MRKRRLLFYLLWILSLVGISFYGGVVSYGLFYALTLLPVILYAYLLAVRIGFTVYQQLGNKYVVSRTPISYYFTLQNETPLAFARLKVLFYEFGVDYGELKREDEYELMPRSGQKVSTNIACRYRGEYAIGIEKIVITDFLGLFSVIYKNREPLRVNVAPAIEYPGKDINPENALFSGNSSQNNPEMRDVTVRPYLPGDSLRSINWKATAKNRKLMSANRIAEEHSSIRILVDTRRYRENPEEYLPAEDAVLTRLITLVLYFVGRNIRTEVSFYSGSLKQVSLSGMQQFEEFYAAVSGINFSTDTDMEAVYAQIMRENQIGEADVLYLRQYEPGEEAEE